MESIQCIHTRCGKRLRVRQEGQSFTVLETCPEGHAGPTSELLNRCGLCQYAESKVVVVRDDGSTVLPKGSPPPPAAPPAAPVTTSMPPAPEVAPAPISRQVDEPAAPAALPPMPVSLPPLPAVAATNDCPICRQPMLCTPAGWACLTPHPQVQPPVILEPSTAILTQLDLPPTAPPVQIDKTELNKADALPLLEDLVLPGGVTLGTPPSSEDAVDVDAVLKQIDGFVGGPSSGGFSSHILADTVCARRTYLKYVLGLEPVSPPTYFKFGTLLHAVLAMRYMHGEARQWEPCDRVAQAGAPSVAAAVKRLLTVQFAKYQKEEWETWCPRGIEYNLMAWLPVKVGKKTVAAPLSCRVDMILGLKKPSEPHPGPGPLPQGVSLLDWKTSSDITYDLVEGYGSDFQFMLQSAIFELGGHAQTFGPLRGIMVSIAQKQRKNARKEPDFDSFQRIEAPISKGRLQEFIECELKPMVTDFYNRLASTELRQQGLTAWPRDVRHCISRWGRCTFYDYCERGNEALFKMDPSRLLVLSELAKPPTGWKAEEEPSSVLEPAAEPQAPKAENQALAIFARALLAGCAAEPYASAFAKSKFFVPGHTPEKVQKQLIEQLKIFYAPSVKAGQKFDLGGCAWSFQKSGLSWTDTAGEKGRLTWKAIAEWICKKEWFDPSKALAE